MKKLSYTLRCIKQNASAFLCYFLRLSCSYCSHSLWPFAIRLWDLATAHSPSGKELNPFSKEDARFS